MIAEMAELAAHYDVLGITATASADEVRRAYHRKAREHHPDVRSGEAGEEMAQVNAAWAVLGDPNRRRTYDIELRLAHRLPAARGTATAGPPPDHRFDEPAVDLDPEVLTPDPPPRPRRVADSLVLVPIALLATAIGAFALAMVTMAPALLVFAVVLVPVAVAAFAAMPILVMRRDRRLSRSPAERPPRRARGARGRDRAPR